ncbi:hypothetical protein GW756_03120 [bacterium]|nr:hypothetical protein [bacterium]NCQ55490.1 hypothetical protein [Candidatus Parcubacteria bacterium]NCS67500.1 hypothetical protein [Candidatus Peregrinibacteria bacterium]NCS96334.1 hypothetical protein [bacterium]
MTREQTNEVDVFSSQFLADSAINELKGLGWIEAETAKVRVLVEEAVGVFLKDRELIKAATIQQKLERSCNARRARLNNASFLKRRQLEEVGIEKPEAESLPMALYPLVYIQMLEKSGVEILQNLRAAYAKMPKGGWNSGRAEFLRILEIELKAKNLPEINLPDVIEMFENVLTAISSRTRLGEILFSDDSEKLKAWNIHFPPHKPKEALIPGEAEIDKAALIKKFLTVRYFTGNPHSAPGVFVGFKQMLGAYVGEREKNYLTVNNLNRNFEVRLAGLTKVDRAKLSEFIAEVKTAWAEKFKQGEPLQITENFTSDGDADRGQLFV